MPSYSVVVTGGQGFVGEAIVTALIEQEPSWNIAVLDLQEAFNSTASPQVRYLKVDITSIAEVQEAFQEFKPTVVIHTAGIIPPLAQRYTRTCEHVVKNINVNGTHNVLKAATDLGVAAFVYTSSCSAVTDDLSGYYAS